MTQSMQLPENPDSEPEEDEEDDESDYPEAERKTERSADKLCFNGRKNKKKAEDFVKQSENSKAVVEKTVELSTVLDTLQKEREDLSEIRRKNEEKIEDLSQELIEAYGEIDALKMHNEQLQDNLRDLENLVGNVTVSIENNRPPLNIPRLDMTDVGFDECTLHSNTERKNSAAVSEFDHEHLAGALAEIVGAHCERLRFVDQ
uniref:BZIP domain-containing protein n=1 Tax=Caenorhabditis tropicalis TaxID=1561998 RepID=A0A1I7TCZ3_9PELO